MSSRENPVKSIPNDSVIPKRKRSIGKYVSGLRASYYAALQLTKLFGDFIIIFVLLYIMLKNPDS